MVWAKVQNSAVGKPFHFDLNNRVTSLRTLILSKERMSFSFLLSFRSPSFLSLLLLLLPSFLCSFFSSRFSLPLRSVRSERWPPECRRELTALPWLECRRSDVLFRSPPSFLSTNTCTPQPWSNRCFLIEPKASFTQTVNVTVFVLFKYGFCSAVYTYFKQECIPVGCVPSAAVAVSRGGLLLGVSATVEGGVCSGGGCLLWGGVCSQGGCSIPACTEAAPPPPLWTDRCR